MFGALTILVVILAIVIATEKPTKEVKKTSQALSTPTPTTTVTPTSQPTTVPKTVTSTPTITPSPTIKPNQTSQTISDFQYPASIVVSKTDNTITLESTDDPKKITDWYKDKIKSMNMNVTTFVQTSINNNILSKLVGANGNQEVRVEISKQNNNAVVKIVVVLN